MTIGSGNYSDAVAEVVVVLTAKETQAAPAAFELIFTLDAGGVTYTASIPTVEGAEYSFDGNTWGATNTRGNVAPNETVTGYMRMAETEDRAASPATLATAPAPLLKVKTPTAAPNGGAFTSVQEITLRCATDGAVIHYTTDGSTPTTASNRYVDSFTVSVTTTVKAIAVKTGMVDSEVLSVTYTKYSGGDSSYTRPKTEMEKLVERIEKAKEGETVKYELSGNTLVVKEVFGALAGRSITLELTTGTVTWIIKGADIQKGTQLKLDLDLGVKVGANVIAMDVINAVTGDKTATQLDLKHSGSFGLEMTMRVTLGTENVGQFANLYYFNKAAGELEYRSAAPIDADGKAALIFSSGAQYLIVIDEINHAPWSNPFADVRESDWFYSAVAYVHTNGLMAGTASAAFSPSKTTTRGMIVTILYRMAGAPPFLVKAQPLPMFLPINIILKRSPGRGQTA